MAEEEKGYRYSKRPLWQWFVIYLIIGALVYGLIYYFVFAKNSYNNSQPAPNASQAPTTSVPAAKNAIQIVNFSFSPATLTVKVGDTVTWTNQDGIGHSATADDKSFDTGILSQRRSRAVTFGKAGTYTYHCSPHPNMRGTIIVQ